MQAVCVNRFTNVLLFLLNSEFSISFYNFIPLKFSREIPNVPTLSWKIFSLLESFCFIIFSFRSTFLLLIYSEVFYFLIMIIFCFIFSKICQSFKRINKFNSYLRCENNFLYFSEKGMNYC